MSSAQAITVIDSQTISVVGSVVSILFLIVTFYIKSSLNKLDKISVLETELHGITERNREVYSDTKILLSNSSKMDERTRHIETRLIAMEVKLEETSKRYNSLRDNSHNLANEINANRAIIETVRLEKTGFGTIR